MNNPKDITAWNFIMEQDDAPTACKATGKELLQQRARALTIAEQKAKQAGEVRELATDKTRNILPTLRREITEGKKHTLSDQVAQQLKAEEMLIVANLEKRYADQLAMTVNGQLSAAFRQHREELLQWIATRRIADIQSHGYTQTITPELQHIYESLSILWQPKWNEGLALNESIRLPLVFDARWVKDAHASVAWVWQHIALGDVRERNGKHFIAAYVESLPHIDEPSRAMRTPPRFGNS
jgi:hypothetical protein